jgi:hypothetical protein
MKHPNPTTETGSHSNLRYDDEESGFHPSKKLLMNPEARMTTIDLVDDDTNESMKQILSIALGIGVKDGKFLRFGAENDETVLLYELSPGYSFIKTLAKVISEHPIPSQNTTKSMQSGDGLTTSSGIQSSDTMDKVDEISDTDRIISIRSIDCFKDDQGNPISWNPQKPTEFTGCLTLHIQSHTTPPTLVIGKVMAVAYPVNEKEGYWLICPDIESNYISQRPALWKVCKSRDAVSQCVQNANQWVGIECLDDGGEVVGRYKDILEIQETTHFRTRGVKLCLAKKQTYCNDFQWKYAVLPSASSYLNSIQPSNQSSR